MGSSNSRRIDQIVRYYFKLITPFIDNPSLDFNIRQTPGDLVMEVLINNEIRTVAHCKYNAKLQT